MSNYLQKKPKLFKEPRVGKLQISSVNVSASIQGGKTGRIWVLIYSSFNKVAGVKV